MAAYQTQQINVGSIAAPDVGSVFANFADRLQKQQSNQIDMARQMRQDDRQQVLNQRADQEWNRQQGARKDIADITKEYMNAPYAAKFVGDEEVAALDKRVQSMPQSVWENLTPEQATALQEKYENVGQNKEVTRTKLMGALMANGNVDYIAANALADDLTKGLMSRADKQAVLDKNLEIQQKNIENQNKIIEDQNKNAIEMYKARLDASGKALQYGVGGTGGGSGGTGGSSKFSGATTNKDVQDFINSGGLGPVDTPSALGLVGRYTDYHPAVVLHALENTTTSGGGLTVDNKVNEEAFLKELTKYSTGQGGLTQLTQEIRNRPVYNIPAEPTLGAYTDPTVTRQVYNSNPDPKKFLDAALTDDRLAFLRTPEEQDKLTKVLAPISTTPTTTSDKKYSGDKMPEGLSYEEKVTWFENRDKVAKGGTEAAYNVEGGKNKGWGRYQMMGSTLDGYRDKFMVDGKPFTNEQFRNDPALQDKVFKQYSADNAQYLANQGIPVNDWTKWLAHNLGAGNVKDFLNRNDSSAGLVSAMQRQSGSPKTVDQYIDKFGQGFNANDLATVLPKGDAKSLYERNLENLGMYKNSAGKWVYRNTNTAEDGYKAPDISNEGAKTIPTPITQEELAKQQQVVKPGWKYLADLMSKGIGDTYDQGKAAVQMVTGPAYDALMGKKSSPKVEAALALANNSVAGLNQIIFSPYTRMKDATDWLITGKRQGSWFDRNAEEAHEKAIQNLEAAGVTNPVTQQALMLGSDMLAPGGVWKEVKYLKNGINLAKDVDYAKVYKDAIVRPRQNGHFSRSLREESEDLENAGIAKARQEAEDLAAKDAEEEALWTRYKADQKAREGTEAAHRRENKRDIEDEAPLRQAEREEILKTRNQAKPTPEQKARAKGALKDKLDEILEKTAGNNQRLQEGNVEAKKFAEDYWKNTVAKYRNGEIDDKELERIMVGLNNGGAIGTDRLMQILRGF